LGGECKALSDIYKHSLTRDDDFFAIAHAQREALIDLSGIIYAHQQLASIGDCVRDLELIARVCSLEELINRIEFLPL
jgi:hypothetical protein